MNEKQPILGHERRDRVRSEYDAYIKLTDGESPKPIRQLIVKNRKLFETGKLNEGAVRTALTKEFNERKAIGDSDDVISEALGRMLSSFKPKS